MRDVRQGGRQRGDDQMRLGCVGNGDWANLDWSGMK